MAPTAPGTNRLTQAEDAMANTLAGLSQFQAWTGTGDLASARARVHIIEWDDFVRSDDNAELFASMPMAIVSDGEDGPSYEIEVMASPWEYQPHFNFTVRFVQKTPAQFRTNKEDKIREIRNAIGAVVDAWALVGNDAGLFAFTRAYADPLMHSGEDNETLPFVTWAFHFEKKSEIQ